jgi:hypothetical protein
MIPENKEDRKMKKMYIAAVAFVLVVFFMAGCTQSTTAVSETASQAAASSDTSASSSQGGESCSVAVDYDMATEEDSQKSVDEGHSPWRLDPAFVAQVFVGGQMEPGGIEGDYPIPYEDFKVTKNEGGEAVVEVDNDQSPTATVCLKQLVRQDDTGIWTVVGYEPK